MTKQEFIKRVAERADVTIKEATAVINAHDAVLMEDVIAEEDKVKLDIGTYSGYTSKPRAARKGRNPRTGEEIEIDAIPAKSGQPKIKFSKKAKE